MKNTLLVFAFLFLFISPANATTPCLPPPEGLSGNLNMNFENVTKDTSRCGHYLFETPVNLSKFGARYSLESTWGVSYPKYPSTDYTEYNNGIKDVVVKAESCPGVENYIKSNRKQVYSLETFLMKYTNACKPLEKEIAGVGMGTLKNAGLGVLILVLLLIVIRLMRKRKLA